MTTDHDQQQTVCDMVCEIRAFIPNLLSLNRFWWARFYKFTESAVYNKKNHSTGRDKFRESYTYSDCLWCWHQFPDASGEPWPGHGAPCLQPPPGRSSPPGSWCWWPHPGTPAEQTQSEEHMKIQNFSLKEKKYNLSVTKAGGYNQRSLSILVHLVHIFTRLNKLFYLWKKCKSIKKTAISPTCSKFLFLAASQRILSPAAITRMNLFLAEEYYFSEKNS